MTEAVPELGAVGGAVQGRAVVLDGELIAHSGTPDSFYALGPQMARRRRVRPTSARATLTFVAFDVLWHDGDITREPYRSRRDILESLELLGPAWCTSPSYVGAGAELFAACTELGLEGLVAKRLDGRYHPGERRDVWIEAKCAARRENHADYRHERR